MKPALGPAAPRAPGEVFACRAQAPGAPARQPWAVLCCLAVWLVATPPAYGQAGAVAAPAADARDAWPPWYLLAPAPMAAPVRRPPAGQEATLAALHRCFMQQIRHHHPAPAPAPASGDAAATAAQTPPADAQGLLHGSADHPLAADSYDAAPVGPVAELFFFDQLASALAELEGPARLLWCRPWFSAPYLRAHNVLSRRSRVARLSAHPDRPTVLLPRRQHHYNHHHDAPRILRAAALAGGDHPLAEQAGLSVEALLGRGGGPSPSDADWLAMTTLVPALYLMDAPHAHAMTPDTGAAPTPAQVEAARQRFVAHLSGTVAAARQADAAGDHALALVQLGVAAHGLQDLFAHRGMTASEHAALTYLHHARPRPGTLAAAATATGPQDPAPLLGALEALFDAVWRRDNALDVAWKDPNATVPKMHLVRLLVAENYRHARATDYAQLLARWQSAYSYAPAGEVAADDQRLQLAQEGRWDVQATLQQLGWYVAAR